MSVKNLLPLATSLMEKGDKAIWIASGLSFLLIGGGAFFYAWTTFYFQVHKGFLHATLILINDLLLVLITMEVLRTIINYLKSHDILLEPFLYIGIIAATRKMLTAGAEISINEFSNEQLFQRYLMDLGINALVVLALGIALYLFRSGRKESHLK